MRLHRLTLTGFGPFRTTQTVDFDALHDAGLFLFEGRTGTGKTSILDAVTFALYGDGDQTARTRVRSDWADPQIPTVVELEATVAGRRLRVRRQARWDRPKKRGTGTTPENERVIISVLTGSGEQPLTAVPQEAGDELSRLLGMSREQFRQIVLLPQGEFATFLRATDDERERVLDRLFSTMRLQHAGQWLAAQRDDARSRLAERDHAVQRQVDLVAAFGHADPPDRPSAAWAEGVLADLTARLSAAGRVEAAARASLSQALACQTSGTATAQRQAELAGWRRREHALGELTARAADAARERADAHRAAPVLPLIEPAAEARRRADAVTRALEEVRRTHDVSEAGDELDRATDQTRGELATLEAARPDEARFTECSARLAEATGLLPAATASVRQLAEREADLPARRAELADALVQARAAVGALSGAQADVARVDQTCDAARERDELDRCLGRARAEATAAHARSLELKQAWLDLRARRLDGLAAELAASLHDGAPCPVCGSVSHPSPAMTGTSSVTAQDEQSAQDLADAALAEHQTLDAEVADLQSRRAAAHAVAGEASVVELADRRACLVQRLADLQRQAADLASLLDRDGALAAERERLTTERRAAEQEQARVAEQVAGLRERTAELRERLAGLAGADGSVSRRIDRLNGRLAAYQAVREAVQAADEATREAARRESHALQSARQSGFATVADARQAARTPEQCLVLDEQVAAARAERAQVRTALADPTLIAVDGVAAVDLPALAEQVQMAQDRYDQAVADRGRLAGDVRQVDAATGELGAQIAEREPVARQVAELDELAGLLDGTGGRYRVKMSLSAFVLAARLEQVAEAASVRLALMTEGRYTLVHHDEATDRRRRAGLGLRVRDAYTGQDRAPASLSGGETFMASLALALGLADVVAAEAGGALLETLFIDEGFGTLDEQTLDEVLDVLDGLRAGGRSVGVVSHVGALRERVSAQVHVEGGDRGSQLRQSVA